MKTRLGFAIYFVIALTIAPMIAVAQLSVTTIGASDARTCYDNAFSGSSSDTTSCADALRDPLISTSDRRKTLVNRGIIHNRNGDIQAAIDDFNAALASDPNLPEAYINRGNSHFLAGRYDLAITDYERALATGLKKAHIAWYNIGLAYESKGEPEMARAAYEKALALNPDFSVARTKLATRRK